MHLFIIDLPISLDVFSPIIFSLLKKGEKVILISIYPVHNYKEDKILNFLINKGLKFHNISNFSLRFNLIYKIIRLVIYILPSSFMRKRYLFWRNFYRSQSFLNYKLLLDYLNKNQIKSLTIDESLPINKQEILSFVAQRKNIPIILIPTGLYTIKDPKILNNKDFKFANFIIFPNDYFIDKDLDSNNKKKIFILGSARYDKEWIQVLDNLNLRLPFNKNKIKIGVFTRYSGNILTKKSDFILELSKSKNIELKFKEKPRTILPEKCDIDKITSTQLINWSDIIISHSTSILIEAIIKNKKILYLNFAQPKEQGSRFVKYSCIKVINSKEELYNDIKNHSQNLKIKFDNNEVDRLLLDFIFKKKNKSILLNYSKFYNFNF